MANDSYSKDDILRTILLANQDVEREPVVVSNLRPELLTPKEMTEELDQLMIGQRGAKEIITVSIWNRLLSLNNRYVNRNEDDYYFEKSNILLIGDTGCGKTHLVKAIAEITSLPVVINDATGMTISGYVGRSVEECIDGLCDKAHAVLNKKYDTKLMSKARRQALMKETIEHGVVYLDEADKLRASDGSQRDISGRGVQESLLTLIEGTEVYPRSPHYRGPIDTSNILFILGGAFTGLQPIIEKRLNSNPVGFSGVQSISQSTDNLVGQVSINDLIEYGMIPELMGRLTNIATLETLDRTMITRIFNEPKRSIMSQIVNEFKSYGVAISFSDDAIEYIVDETMKLELGARGLRSTCQKVLRQLYFYMPSHSDREELVVTKKLILLMQDGGNL